MDDSVWVVEQLTAARKALKLTQADVAKRLGTTQSHISDIENFVHSPSMRTIAKYANVVGLQLVLIRQQPLIKGEQ